MSLRAFHMLFIAVSVILTVFFAVWAADQQRVTNNLGFALAGVLSLGCGIGLSVYGVKFQRKTRQF
jgi:hypothetical protein